ncbi:MAG: TetR/AcrR family transcriptional regulator [Myxococcaceae bacterium]
MQKEVTAARVLEAARDEFERVGFEAANVRAIARRAAVSPGTVIHHFGDKHELLHAALFESLDAALKQGVDVPADDGLEDRLDHLAQTVFTEYRRRPRLSRTLLKEALFADGDWARRFAAQTGAVHAAIEAWGRHEVAEGRLPRRFDARSFALAWLSYFYFALIAWAQGQHRSPVRLVANLTAQHLLPWKEWRRR